MYYILKDREVVEEPNLEVWSRWMGYSERNNHRTVKLSSNDKATVSTVFLGTDHGFLADSAPVVFETMVFFQGGEEEEDDLFARYCLWDEAMEGHITACRTYGVPLDPIPIPDPILLGPRRLCLIRRRKRGYKS